MSFNHLPTTVKTQALSYLSFADWMRIQATSKEMRAAAEPLLNPERHPVPRLAMQIRNADRVRDVRRIQAEMAAAETIPEEERAFFTEHINRSLRRVDRERSWSENCKDGAILICFMGVFCLVFSAINFAVRNKKLTGVISAGVGGGLLVLSCCCCMLQICHSIKQQSRLSYYREELYAPV